MPDEATDSTYDARGQLVRLQGTSDINRYYTGDGREAKRRKITNSFEEITYYIRSSVLGNETITEVNNTGRKLKTIVRAAGATLVWQTVHHNTNNNTDSEYVNFEHWDASGLSYRSTTTSGDAMMGQGTEGAPAELNPLGGNVGLSSPYLFASGGENGGCSIELVSIQPSNQ